MAGESELYFQRGRPFQRGRSGNPKGTPKGTGTGPRPSPKHSSPFTTEAQRQQGLTGEGRV